MTKEEIENVHLQSDSVAMVTLKIHISEAAAFILWE